jgi:2-amino-4-hydroxy-6-hydroxymethyldihydropteridine diphosphokinase
VATVYLGLGSNIGDRAAHLWEAVRRLSALDGCCVRRVSRLYETGPVGPPQRSYLNSVAAADVVMSPHDLLGAAKRIEHEMGRVPSEHWGPRRIDIDLLLFGDETVADPDLTLPHPQLWNRRFVLAPLADVVAPGPLADRVLRRLAEVGNEKDVRIYA